MPSDAISIRGLQKAQQAMLRRINAVKPGGAAGKALHFVTVGMFRHAVQITHVDTGALRAGRHMEIDLKEMTGTIFVDPGAVNPQSKTPPAEYDVYEQARGGPHATYARTLNEVGLSLGMQGIRMISKAI